MVVVVVVAEFANHVLKVIFSDKWSGCNQIATN